MSGRTRLPSTRMLGAVATVMMALALSPLGAPSEASIPVDLEGSVSTESVVRELTTFAAPGCTGGCGSGSTVGPDGALYVTDGPGGRVLRVDRWSGATTTYVDGLPRAIPEVGIGGAIDVAFIRHTAYVLVTLVGPEFGQPDVVSGVYRIGKHGRPRAIAAVGAWSAAHPPATDFFIASGVQYALDRVRDELVITDGHHNRLLTVDRSGRIRELRALGNVVPTGVEAVGRMLFLAQAGPIPHRPADGRVVRLPRGSDPVEVAAGVPLAVDVEVGRGRLYALSQGVWDLPPTPENEGKPAAPDTGAILRLERNGALRTVVDGLDRPTSLEIVHGTAFVVTLTGKVLRIDGHSM